MNADSSPVDPAVLAGAGALAVVVGPYLRWVVVAAGVDVVPSIYISGMQRGYAAGDLLVLCLLAVGLAAAARYRSRRRGGTLATATGVLVVAYTAAWTLAVLGDGGVAFGAFVPGPGVFLTAAGGVGLAIAGWLHRSGTAATVGGERTSDAPA